MSLRLALVVAALVVCAQAQYMDYLNFGTYAEDFMPANNFILTTVNDLAGINRGFRPGLLQTSTVIVVKVGANVTGIQEGDSVYPALQTGINSDLTAATSVSLAVDTIAYCPQPLDINAYALRGPAVSGFSNPNGVVPNPISQVITPIDDPTSTTSNTETTVIRGRYCIYHESQIAAVINNNAVRGSPGSSQIVNTKTFIPNLSGTTRPTL